MKILLGEAIDKILEYEWVVLLLIAYPMLFPKAETTPIMLVIPALWILHWIREGQPLPTTPLNQPILLISIMLLVSLWATYSIEFSLVKISGLIFSVGVYFTTVRLGTKSISQTVWFFLICGIALSGLGLLATNWPTKIPILSTVIDRLPQVITRLPAAESGIHPNELGGILLLFAPLTLWLVYRGSRLWVKEHLLQVILAWLIAIWFCLLLFLTQSRSALLGFAGAVAAFLLLSGRAGRWIFLIGSVAVVFGLILIGPGQLLGIPGFQSSGATVLGDVGFSARLEIWARAILGIEHFPYTGMGLGTFRKVIPTLYPFFLIPPEKDIAHAHNLLLQTGQDLGMAGMIALLSIWAVLFIMLFLGLRTRRGSPILLGCSHHDLFQGLLGSMLAFFIFSLTDAIALGARPGFLMWMTLGVIAALYSSVAEQEHAFEMMPVEIVHDQTLPGLSPVGHR